MLPDISPADWQVMLEKECEQTKFWRAKWDDTFNDFCHEQDRRERAERDLERLRTKQAMLTWFVPTLLCWLVAMPLFCVFFPVWWAYALCARRGTRGKHRISWCAFGVRVELRS